MNLNDFLIERQDLTERAGKQYVQAFNKLSSFTEEDPFNLNRRQINKALSEMSQHLKPSSYNAYVNCIRRYYKWRYGGDEDYPEAVKHVKLKKLRRIDYVKKKILTHKEVKALIRSCDHPRDAAILSVAIATGVRKGELLNMKIRDVLVKPGFYRINVEGKTGAHTTRPIVGSHAKRLRVWLEHHPARDNPDAPLWVRKKAGPHGSQFTGLHSTEMHNIVKRAAARAGLKRNVHLHMFRHTENTWSTPHISRASRNKTHGWSPRGNTAAIYENLTDEDAEKEYLAAAGLTPVEEKADPFSTVKCSFCGEENAAEMKYCGFCGVVLDAEAAQRMIKREQMLDDLIYLLKDPKKLQQFMENNKNL